MFRCTRLNKSLLYLTDTQTPPIPLIPLLLSVPSQSPIQGPIDPSDVPLLDRLSDSSTPLNYLEPDLAETNPTAFAQKLQVCREALLPYFFSPGLLLPCVFVYCLYLLHCEKHFHIQYLNLCFIFVLSLCAVITQVCLSDNIKPRFFTV